jgi:hypothetical protein
MKKVILFLSVTILAACSNDETIKEVPVEVIKEVPVNVIKETNIIDKIEPYIKTLEKDGRGISHVGASNYLKTEIKRCLSTTDGLTYDSFNIYIGNQRHDGKDSSNNPRYGSEGYIIVVFFKRTINQEISIYQPYGNYYRFYDKLIQVNYPLADNFFNNKFIGSMTKEDFLKL